MGAALFTLGLLAVLVGATYLIQIALWLFAFVLFATMWAVRATVTAAGALCWCVWWLVQREAAVVSLRQAEAG